MSLYLIELKIKTALELVEELDRLNCHNKTHPATARFSHYIDSLDGVLREIINRPKEEGSNNG